MPILGILNDAIKKLEQYDGNYKQKAEEVKDYLLRKKQEFIKQLEED